MQKLRQGSYGSAIPENLEDCGKQKKAENEDDQQLNPGLTILYKDHHPLVIVFGLFSFFGSIFAFRIETTTTLEAT